MNTGLSFWSEGVSWDVTALRKDPRFGSLYAWAEEYIGQMVDDVNKTGRFKPTIYLLGEPEMGKFWQLSLPLRHYLSLSSEEAPLTYLVDTFVKTSARVNGFALLILFPSLLRDSSEALVSMLEFKNEKGYQEQIRMFPVERDKWHRASVPVELARGEFFFPNDYDFLIAAERHRRTA